jgi:ribosomal protein S18 acetylase RimI-like enzyme
MLPPGYTVRRPRDADLLPALDATGEAELADFGARWLQEEDMRIAWSTMDRERDLWVVADEGGSVVASAGIRVSQPVQMWFWAPVRPAHRGRGLGTELLGLVEGRAAEVVPDAPADTRVILRQFVGERNESARRLLTAHGYRFTRRFWTMAIDLDEEPPAPKWPPEVRVASLEAGQERAVFDAMADAFADHWGFVPEDFDRWRAWTVDRDSFDATLWRLVWDGDELAAASMNALRGEEGWVNVLGVRRRWRRRGIALALLHESFREFRRRGTPRVLLGVDSENPTGATRLYERAGMHVERTMDNYEKVLRDGADPAAVKPS